MEFDIFTVLAMLVPVVVGILTVPIFNGLKKVVAFIDAFPAWIKQLLVPVVSYGLVFLGTLLQIPLPESLHLFDLESVQAVLGAIAAMAIYAGTKKPPQPVSSVD